MILFVVVDRFSKMTYFISYHNIDDAHFIANVFFQEVVILNGLHRNIVSRRNL